MTRMPGPVAIARKLTPLLLLWACARTGAADPAAAPACAPLCGTWRLDAAASDTPATVLDAAFTQFKEPKPRRQRRPSPGDSIEVMGQAEEDAVVGPILKRPHRKDLREELDHLLYQPRTLTIGPAEDGIRIALDDHPAALSLTPGVNHARVDQYGTAKIGVKWRARQQLVVTESYDSKNSQETTYSLQAGDGSLRVVQVVGRSGLPRITLHSVYRTP